jgi:hypothetical protein
MYCRQLGSFDPSAGPDLAFETRETAKRHLDPTRPTTQTRSQPSPPRFCIRAPASYEP